VFWLDGLCDPRSDSFRDQDQISVFEHSLAETAVFWGSGILDGGRGGIRPVGPVGAVNFPKEHFCVDCQPGATTD
jgi:hypothetical protein